MGFLPVQWGSSQQRSSRAVPGRRRSRSGVDRAAGRGTRWDAGCRTGSDRVRVARARAVPSVPGSRRNRPPPAETLRAGASSHRLRTGLAMARDAVALVLVLVLRGFALWLLVPTVSSSGCSWIQFVDSCTAGRGDSRPTQRSPAHRSYVGFHRRPTGTSTPCQAPSSPPRDRRGRPGRGALLTPSARVGLRDCAHPNGEIVELASPHAAARLRAASSPVGSGRVRSALLPENNSHH